MNKKLFNSLKKPFAYHLVIQLDSIQTTLVSNLVNL